MRPMSEFGCRIIGLDISNELLELSASESTIQAEIASESFCGESLHKIDQEPIKAIYVWAVFMYFTDSQIAIALNNLLRITSSPILIFEWGDVCRRIESVREVLASEDLTRQLKLHRIPHFLHN